MKVKVIEEKCIGCGNCVALSESQIFDFNDAGLAQAIVDEVPTDLEEVAKDAIIQCPTEAIEEINE
ncbi:MAG: ferredoxin [Bacilli bacterium]|nr:ferredoxin [Bacilli bacterium]